MSANDSATLTLTEDQALVLFELLQRWIDDENGKKIKPHTRHEAEMWVLNSLNCQLEPIMTPFPDNYVALLEAARNRLSERAGAWRFDPES